MFDLPKTTSTKSVALAAHISFGVLAACYLVSCKARVPNVPEPTGRAILKDTTYAGFSGLTFDDRGRLWAVPERRAVLVRLAVAGAALTVAEVVPIEGHPDGYDLESVEYFGGQFFIGTEHLRPDRTSDPVLVVEVEGSRARVVRTLSFSYEPWKIRASRNNGLEGVCVTEKYLVASAEIGLGTSERRAPVAVIDRLTGRPKQAYKVKLTSETGKFSALECRLRGESIELLAVERHFGIARLVSVTLPLDGSTTLVTGHVVADMSRRLSPLPNIEGIARGRDGKLYAITDNQARAASGPTMLFYGTLGEGLFAGPGEAVKP